MNARQTRSPLLDSFRAIGVFAIIVGHTVGPAGAIASPTLRPYAARMAFALAIFFLLSAFLLYRPYVRARLDGKPWPSARVYAWNRLLRTVPVYWVALTIAAVWGTTAGPAVFSARGIPTYYGFAQIYWPDTGLGGIAIAWFLCVLVVFYAVLPLYAALMRRTGGRDRRARFRRELAGCASLFALSVAYQLFLELTGLRSVPPFHFLLPAWTDWLAVGMVLAVLSVWYGERPPASAEPGVAADLPGRRPTALSVIDRFPSLGVAAALLLFWVLSTRIGLHGGYPGQYSHVQYLAEHQLNLAIALALFLPVVFGNPSRGLTRRLLGNRVIVYLGVVSYGILLYHLSVLFQLEHWHFSPPTGAASYLSWPLLTLAGAAVIATANHYWLERPLSRLRRVVGPGRTAAADAKAVEPATSRPVATADSR